MTPSYPNERRDGLPELAAHGASTTESWTSAGSQSSDSDRVLTDPEQAGAWSSNADAIVKITRLRDALHDVQREFLKIEKFANLNTTACYKILKKHDKLIPATVCCRYYMERLHQKPWVNADHSAVFVVQMSDLFEKLRPRRSEKASAAQGNGPAGGPGAQDFVRTTRKYWVATEDVSSVKQAIAEHLPVFLMEREKRVNIVELGEEIVAAPKPGVAADSQMTSSVYLDNVNLGLYHNRLQKQPHSIAVRLRWYGLDPTGGVVFVERKTHRESWTGEESVKERFTLPPDLVVPFLQGQHTWDMEEARLIEAHARKAQKNAAPGSSPVQKGMSKAELAGIKKLFVEVQRAVESKQLEPALRTMYMRTAFQVPFDASVRCSLDTSLCMVAENPVNGPTCVAMNRWFRDPELPVHRTEVTRFPHAVLEIKLALDAGQDPPRWVDDLIASGCLTEVHKFSKFMHGCAVLFPDVAQEVPYWVDDVSLRQSLQNSASRETGAAVARANSKRVKNAPGPVSPNDSQSNGVHLRPNDDLNGDLTHPLLVGATSDTVLDLMGDSRQNADLGDGDDGNAVGSLGGGGRGGIIRRGLSAGSRFLRRRFGLGGGPSPGGRAPGQPARTVPMRIEPKTYFANERTFLSWLHTAVLIGTIGAGLVSVHMGRAGQPRADSAANAPDALNRVASNERVLTVVHRHEYKVVFDNQIDGLSSPVVTRNQPDGDLGSVDSGGMATSAIEEIVSRAIAGYFESANVPSDQALNQGLNQGLNQAQLNQGLNQGHAHALTSSAGDSIADTGEYTSMGLSVALCMLSASVCLCVYATWTFIWRGQQISKRSSVPFHDPIGPVVMGSVLIVTMVLLIAITAANYGEITD